MRITFTEMALATRIGISKEERGKEQRIVIDISLDAENIGAHKTDAIEDTVNYQHIFDAVKQLAKKERKTLEKLVEDIAQTILKFERVKTVTVTVKKFILPATKNVSLTITRP
jgi:7,8-dihydroneopterin aldolase/epimerase/oxygenase